MLVTPTIIDSSVARPILYALYDNVVAGQPINSSLINVDKARAFVPNRTQQQFVSWDLRNSTEFNSIWQPVSYVPAGQISIGNNASLTGDGKAIFDILVVVDLVFDQINL